MPEVPFLVRYDHFAQKKARSPCRDRLALPAGKLIYSCVQHGTLQPSVVGRCVLNITNQMQRWPFAGRETELNKFTKMLADPHALGFVVFGPPGVGKSRLAKECLSAGVRAGWKGAVATASAAASTVPLGAVAHLVPDGVDLSDPVRGFANVAKALRAPNRQRRLLVWVDDLHLLDATSAVLLRQLMDAGVIRLLATVRTGSSHSDAVEALCRGDAVYRVDLTEFDLAQSEHLLQMVLGGPVGQRTLHYLQQTSRGNALFLHELVLGAHSVGAWSKDGEVWEITKTPLQGTPRLVELVEARLAAAGASGRALLELLALCEPLPLADGEAVVSPAALSELEQLGLVLTERSRRRTTLQLAHPLYGEVLREQIPPLRRRTLLLDQVARTEARGARRSHDLLRIAAWRLAATGTADPKLLTHAASLSFHAHDYAQVVELLKAVPAQHNTTTTQILLGYALMHLGEWQSADEILAEARATVIDERQMLEVTLFRAMSLFWIGTRTTEALALVRETREEVTNSAGRRALAVIEGYIRVISGQPAAGLALLEENLEPDAEQSYDLKIWLRGALAKTLALTAVGRTQEAVAWCDHAYATHRRAHDDGLLVPHPATQLSTPALTDAGQLTKAAAVSEKAFSDLLRSMNTDGPRIRVAFCLGRAAWHAGHVKTARRWLAEAAASAHGVGHPRALPEILSYLAASAAQAGDVRGASATLEELEKLPPTGSFLAGEERLGEAWLLAARGLLADARKVLREAADEARTSGFLTSEVTLLTDIARLGGAEEATDRLSLLAERCDGPFNLARARLAAALAADDPVELGAVAAALHDIGADLMAAEAANAAAVAWDRRGHPRRATAARNRASLSLARCEGAWTPLLVPAQVSSTLTSREQEIALLAADNTPSKEIAELLKLSVRTVDNHLQHAYTKLGVTTRRQLAEVMDIRPSKRDRRASV